MEEAILKVLENNGVLAAAFAAWAYVVWHFGQKLLAEVQDLNERVRQINYSVSNRLTKIEAHLESGGDFKPYRNGDS